VWVPDAPRAVLYLNDGQNVFASPRSRRPKWRADAIAARLIDAGEIAPLAIVAIDHGGPVRRWREYLPYADPRNPRARWFEADRYADLLVERIVPAVRKAHPAIVRARTVAIGGSSYGAIAALHAAIRHPRVFDALLIESPPLWVGDGRLIADAAAVRAVRVWIGVGTHESARPERSVDLVRLARRLGRTLRARAAVRLAVGAGARHGEDAWAARLPDALRWLFPPD
jgi:predicted alpha/beta superfamily hydrolase